jgi:hypothetical protein
MLDGEARRWGPRWVVGISYLLAGSSLRWPFGKWATSRQPDGQRTIKGDTSAHGVMSYTSKRPLARLNLALSLSLSQLAKPSRFVASFFHREEPIPASSSTRPPPCLFPLKTSCQGCPTYRNLMKSASPSLLLLILAAAAAVFLLEGVHGLPRAPKSSSSSYFSSMRGGGGSSSLSSPFLETDSFGNLRSSSPRTYARASSSRRSRRRARSSSSSTSSAAPFWESGAKEMDKWRGGGGGGGRSSPGWGLGGGSSGRSRARRTRSGAEARPSRTLDYDDWRM